MKTTISTKETTITDAISVIDKQLVEVNVKLGALCLARQDQGETEADRTSAISQVAVQQTALGESRKLLEDLLSAVQAAAANAQTDQGRVVNTFGDNNRGIQIGVSHGPISGTFGRQE